MLNTAKNFRLPCKNEHGAPKPFSVFCLLTIGLFYLTAATNTVSAATYYLDAVNGDDSNPGDSGAPWKTMERAMSDYSGSPAVRAGDTVYLRTGNYGEVVFQYNPASYAPAPSSWESKITYIKEPGETPELVYLRIKQNYDYYFEFNGLRVVDTNESDSGPIVHVQGSRYLRFKNMYICGNGSDELESGWSSHGFQIEAYSSGGTFYPKNILVDNCEITRCMDGIEGYYIDEGIEFTNNHIYFMGLTGIKVTYFELSEPALIAYNHIENQREVGDAHGSGISLRGYPVTLRGNVVHNYGRTGGISLYTSDYWDVNDGYQDLLFENNLVYDIHNVTSVRLGFLGANCTFRNNTFISRHEAGGSPENPKLHFGAGCNIEGATNADMSTIKFYNNVVAGSIGLHEDYNLMDESNNIVWVGLYDYSAVSHITEGSNTILVVDGNNEASDYNYFDGSGNFFIGGAEFDEWSYVLGDNLNSHEKDLTDDYKLASGSPAIGFANPAHAPGVDAEHPNGVDITRQDRDSIPDAGCYEYVSSDPNNQPPVLDAIGDKSVDENVALTFTVNATDADGDTITYSDQNLPSGATFSSPFSWTPSYSQAGSYQVTFIASDGSAQDSETIIITVNNVNRAPVLAAIGNQSVNEGSLLSFSASATDPDGDTITYSAQNLPSGATFSSQTFGWTPSYSQAGSYNITIIAADAEDQDSETITVTVGNTNRPPVLATIGNRTVNENTTLNFSVSATDADGNPITYSVEDLPSGAAFASQSFIWTPGYDQAGTFEVTFNASDGQDQDSETITITVSNVNRAPVLDAITDKSVNDGTLLTFAVNATDPDGDTIEYSATGLPSGAAFSGQTFSWIPAYNQADNSYQVTFIASDGQLQDSQVVNIVVSDTSAPVVANCSPAAGSIQAPLNSLIILHVTDAGEGVDNSSVTITVDDNIVYTGNIDHYASSTGDCRRSGTESDYTFIYQPDEIFDFDQTVSVTVNATDLAGNLMPEHSYSFKTEMRSFGENKKVSSQDIGKGMPGTVCDSSGNIWVAWHAGPTGNRDIYLSKLTSGAGNFGAAVQLTNNSVDQCNPAISLDDSDKLYVVWQDNRRGNWDIFVSTSADGVNWSAETRVTDSNDNQINPAIVIDGRSPNRAYIAWQDDRNGNQDIYVATSQNSFVTKTISQITSDTSNQLAPAIAADSSNTIYMVWTDARNASTDIYAAASDSGPWTNVAVVSNAYNQSSPAITAESAGSVLHLLWVDDTSGDLDIYYALSDGLPASPLNGSSIIDDTSGAEQWAPAIVTTGNTGNNLRVFACWQDGRNLSGTNSDTDLYFARLNSGSGTNILVGDDGTNSSQSEPAMATDEYGHPYLVWTDGRNTNQEIYYAGSTFVAPVALKSENVTASSGATVGTEPAAINDVDDVSVIVPAGACPSDVQITISRIENPRKHTLERLSLPYEFGPSGLEFDQPVIITIPYEVSESSNTASVYWYNSLTGTLSQEGITDIETIVMSPTLHALQFKTTHFTEFLIGGGIAAAVGGGGGGGGGCSISATSQGSIAEFLVPYIGLAAAMVIIRLRDMRNRKARNIKKG